MDIDKDLARWNREVGKRGEDAVLALLISQGYRFITRNYVVNRLGELDLILFKDDCIVVVEVKSRKNSDTMGGAVHAISPVKRLKMLRATRLFLIHKQWEAYNVRFLAGCVTHDLKGNIQNIEILPI